MQVLAERITALITVIQSFAFFFFFSFSPPHPNTTLVLSLFLVNSQMPFTDILPTCFARGAKAYVTPRRRRGGRNNKKKKRRQPRSLEVRIVKERKAQ